MFNPHQSDPNQPPYTWPDTWPQRRRRRGGWFWLLLLVATIGVVAWRLGLLG